MWARALRRNSRRITSTWLPTLAAIFLSRLARRERPGAIPGAPRVLIVRLDGIGDSILTTPMIAALKERLPEASITVVAPGIAADVFHGNPDVARVIAVPALPPRNVLRLLWILVKLYRERLSATAFDVVICPRWDVDDRGATFLCALTGAPVLMGYEDQTSPERAFINRGFERLFTHRLPAGPVQHEALRNLAFVEALTGERVRRFVPLKVVSSAQDAAEAERWLAAAGFDREQALIFLGLPAAFASKRWGADNFAAAARLLARDRQAGVIFVADRDTVADAERQRAALKGIVSAVACNLPLGLLHALLSRGAVYVGNDGGIGHLAASAQIPLVIVAVHPRTGGVGHVRSPVRFAPWTERVLVLQPEQAAAPECVDGCVRAEAHCIRMVQPETVAAAAEEVLNGVYGSGR